MSHTTEAAELIDSISADLGKLKALIATPEPPPTPDPEPEPEPQPEPAGHYGYARPTVITPVTPVYFVTTLGDDGEGSLRHGVDLPRPNGLEIRPAVSGLVNLKRSLRITKPHLSINGFDKPFGTKGNGVHIRASDVALRYMYFYLDAGGRNPSNAKPLQITIGERQNKGYTDIIIDHGQIIGGPDGGLDLWNGSAEAYNGKAMVERVSILNSVIAWTLADAGHSEGQHSRAMLISEGFERLTIWGNLFFGSHTRVPYLKDGRTIEYGSNVIDNTGTGVRFIAHSNASPEPLRANLYGNVFGRVGGKPFQLNDKDAAHQLYLKDNGYFNHRTGKVTIPEDQRSMTNIPTRNLTSNPHEWSGPGLPMLSGQDTLDYVLANVGPGHNDPHIDRLRDAVWRGIYGGLIDSLEEIGGYPF